MCAVVTAQDPTTRALIARVAAAERWARISPDERPAATKAARDARLEQFARQADPEGRLSEPERLAAAEQLRYAHMLRMSLRAKQVRSRRTAEQAEAVPAPIPLRRHRGDPATRVDAGGGDAA